MEICIENKSKESKEQKYFIKETENQYQKHGFISLQSPSRASTAGDLDSFPMRFFLCFGRLCIFDTDDHHFWKVLLHVDHVPNPLLDL